jgi:hypothetical protein
MYVFLLFDFIKKIRYFQSLFFISFIKLQFIVGPLIYWNQSKIKQIILIKRIYYKPNWYNIQYDLVIFLVLFLVIFLVLFLLNSYNFFYVSL